MADDRNNPLVRIDPDGLMAGLVAMLAKASRPQTFTDADGNETETFSRDLVDIASELRELFEQVVRLRSAAEHDAFMRSVEDPVALAEYLGKLGESEEGLDQFLGREATEEELGAYERGQRERLLRVRAIELEQAARTGTVPKWMRR